MRSRIDWVTRATVMMGVLIQSGCMSTPLTLTLPSGETKSIAFYTGGSSMEDLVIIDGTNYFGKAQYQMDDPLGDIGFRLTSGERVQAECTSIGKNSLGKDECKIYTVYRSSFPPIPVGTTAPKPD